LGVVGGVVVGGVEWALLLLLMVCMCIIQVQLDIVLLFKLCLSRTKPYAIKYLSQIICSGPLLLTCTNIIVQCRFSV